jgi:hypothetical protein
MSEQVNIALRRVRSKSWREEGGKDGFAVYTEADSGLSVAIHPRSVRAALLQNIEQTRND